VRLATLERLAARGDTDPFDGVILEYTHPLTGGPAMPTVGCHRQRLRPGARTRAHRHTSNTVYHVVEGEGRSIVDGQRLEWADKDVFVVPTSGVRRRAASAARPSTTRRSPHRS
jgi:gentisate 1,2-dioxygenase